MDSDYFLSVQVASKHDGLTQLTGSDMHLLSGGAVATETRREVRNHDDCQISVKLLQHQALAEETEE